VSPGAAPAESRKLGSGTRPLAFISPTAWGRCLRRRQRGHHQAPHSSDRRYPPTGRVPNHKTSDTMDLRRLPTPFPHCPSGASLPPPRAGETNERTGFDRCTPPGERAHVAPLGPARRAGARGAKGFLSLARCMSGRTQREYGPVGRMEPPVGVNAIPIPCSFGCHCDGKMGSAVKDEARGGA